MKVWKSVPIKPHKRKGAWLSTYQNWKIPIFCQSLNRRVIKSLQSWFLLGRDFNWTDRDVPIGSHRPNQGLQKPCTSKHPKRDSSKKNLLAGHYRSGVFICPWVHCTVCTGHTHWPQCLLILIKCWGVTFIVRFQDACSQVLHSPDLLPHLLL